MLCDAGSHVKVVSLDSVEVDLTSLKVKNNIVTVKFKVRNEGDEKQTVRVDYKECYIMDEENHIIAVIGDGSFTARLAFEGLMQIIRSGQQAGLYIDKDTQLLATSVWSQAHGLAMLVTGKQMGDLNRTELEAMTQEMLDLLLSGLKKN